MMPARVLGIILNPKLVEQIKARARPGTGSAGDSNHSLVFDWLKIKLNFVNTSMFVQSAMHVCMHVWCGKLGNATQLGAVPSLYVVNM